MTTPAENYDHISNNGEYDYDHVSNNGEYDYDYKDTVEICETEHVDHLYHLLSLHVYPIAIVLGLLGNLLVIVTYALYKKTKSMTDVCLLNVAVADMLFVLVLPFIVYNEQQNWVMGDAACKVLSGAYSLNLYSGALLLGYISIARYLSITKRSHKVLDSRAMCAVIWVMALLVSLPTFIYTGLDRNSPESHLSDMQLMSSKSDGDQSEPPMTMSMSNSSVTLWGNHSEYTDYDYAENSTLDYSGYWEEEEPAGECTFRYENSAHHMSIFIPSLQMAIGLLLPLLVMTLCYTAIISTLLKAHNFHNHKPKEWVVLTVVLVFIICHLPYNLTFLVRTITLWHQTECSSEIAILVGLGITRTLSYMHCGINPILYTFSGVCFRSHFRKFLWDIRHTDMQVQRSEVPLMMLQ